MSNDHDQIVTPKIFKFSSHFKGRPIVKIKYQKVQTAPSDKKRIGSFKFPKAPGSATSQ